MLLRTAPETRTTQHGAGNKSSLFREKNLERLESPEKLNDYLRVTSPGVWMVLGAVIVLLIGVCIWGVFGRIQATRQAVVITESGESSCLVPQSALEGVLQYRTIEIDEEKRELVPDVLEPQVITESTNVYVMLAGGLRVGRYRISDLAGRVLENRRNRDRQSGDRGAVAAVAAI